MISNFDHSYINASEKYILIRQRHFQHLNGSAPSTRLVFLAFRFNLTLVRRFIERLRGFQEIKSMLAVIKMIKRRFGSSKTF